MMKCAGKALRSVLFLFLPCGILRLFGYKPEKKRKKAAEPLFDMQCEPLPVLYNTEGSRVKLVYLQDRHLAHTPYTYRECTYILWDRYAYGLDTHVYTHREALATKGVPCAKHAWLLEPPPITPKDYELFYNNPGLCAEFDSIFTHEERLLDKIPNARFLPGCANVWYGSPFGGGELSESAYESKPKNISVLASNKGFCEMHQTRVRLAKFARNTGKVEGFGAFDGGPRIDKVAEALTDYRYSIAIENSISDYYFTEKITNCFAAMTVPIYIGARRIGDFFNMDGIIQVHSCDEAELERAIGRCGPEDYRARLEAVRENYRRVQKYLSIEKYFVEQGLL